VCARRMAATSVPWAAISLASGCRLPYHRVKALLKLGTLSLPTWKVASQGFEGLHACLRKVAGVDELVAIAARTTTQTSVLHDELEQNSSRPSRPLSIMVGQRRTTTSKSFWNSSSSFRRPVLTLRIFQQVRRVVFRTGGPYYSPTGVLEVNTSFLTPASRAH